MTTEAKTQEKEAPKTHNCTKTVNDAIAKHGSPLLKHLSKDAPFVEDFRYRPGKGFIKVGTSFANGRQIGCYRKGIMWLRGEVSEHINALPKTIMQELSTVVMATLMSELEEGQDQRQVLLQAFNRKVQEDINAAVEKSGGEPFAFEQDYVNSAGFDSKVFVLMAYDGNMPSEERLEEIEANNIQRKHQRMADAAKKSAVDARVGSAEYVKA